MNIEKTKKEMEIVYGQFVLDMAQFVDKWVKDHPEIKNSGKIGATALVAGIGASSALFIRELRNKEYGSKEFFRRILVNKLDQKLGTMND